MSLAFVSSTVSVSTTTDPNGRITSRVQATPLAVTGATGAVTFQLVGGTLPPGLNLDSTGSFNGMPQGRGASLVTVRATDSSSPPLFADAAITVSTT